MENSHYSNNNPNNNIGSRRGRGGQAGHGGRGATIGFMSFRTPRRFANDEEHSSSVGGAAAASPSSPHSSSAAALSMMPTKRQRIRLDSNNAANQRRDGAGFWEDRGGEREQHERRANANNNFGRQNRPNGVNPKPLHPQYRRQHQHQSHHQQNQQQQQQHQFRQPQNFIAQANQFRAPSTTVGGTTSSGPTNQQPQPFDANSAMQQQQIRSAELSDIPGFSYDPVTKKYFKILEDKPGQPSGSTLRHLRNLAVNAASSNFGDSPGGGGRRPTPPAINLPALLNRLQVSGGGRSQLLANARSIEEARLRCVKAMPSYRFEVVDNWSQRFDSCQFLDVSEDGRTLLGCWSTERHDIFSAQCSRVLSFTVGVNPESGRRDAELADLDPQHPKLHDTNGRFACNTYGLQFTALDNGICLETSHQQLVDMALAPADRDVTCLLFATAGSIFEQKSVNACPRIITKCIVNLRPIEFNLTEEGRESMSSPIYNAEWTSNEPIWSLCFNSHHMKICVGMEKNARILNVLSGQDFLVSSGGRNVISCLFSKDGNSLHLGRKCANISLLDLRMPSNHSIGELPGTPSSSFMYLFRERGNTLLSENFEGKIKLWDLRMRRELLQMEAGHRNSSHKLPMFVDSEERLVFAVGEDSAVRGWSLHSGELLCSVNSPRAHIQQKAQAQMRSGGGRRSGGGGMQTADESTTTSSTCAIDFPRVVYSSSWGGRVGNSALLFAVNGDLLVHELSL